MSNGTVIVGASQAGVQLAASLREGGYTKPITLVDSANHEPYQRPPLSKDFLAGTVDAQGLRFRDRDYYAAQNIELVLGYPAVRAERSAEGGAITTAEGKQLPYEHLALATGAAPRRLAIPGADLENIFALRDADDATRLKDSFRNARNIVVIGGGFIGLEVAASALKHGKSVTVLEAAPRIIGRAVGEETSSWFLHAHRARGMRVETDVNLLGFHGSQRNVEAVELADGTVVPADIVVVGIGVIPRTELAEQLGLEVANGVVVDEHSLSSDHSTLAVGDVASIPNPYSRCVEAMARIRLESVNNAIEQARFAARTILGEPQPYISVPWFWSNQGDIKLQMSGLNIGYDHVVIRGDQQADKFSVLYFRGDVLLGADCINSPADFMAVRQALAKEKHLTPEDAIRPEPLKNLFTDVDTARIF